MTHRFYENQYGCIYFDKQLVTPVGRVNFLNIATPGAKFKKYSATLYMDKNSVNEQQQAFQEVTNACGEILQAKFGDAQAQVKYPTFRDGDSGKSAEVEAAHGNWCIIGNNTKQPDVFDSEGNDFDKSQLQSGMTCRFVVKPGVNDDGIFYQLEGIQVIADDGTRFRAGPNPRHIAGTVPGGLVAGGGQAGVASTPVATPAAPATPAPSPATAAATPAAPNGPAAPAAAPQPEQAAVPTGSMENALDMV